MIGHYFEKTKIQNSSHSNFLLNSPCHAISDAMTLAYLQCRIIELTLFGTALLLLLPQTLQLTLPFLHGQALVTVLLGDIKERDNTKTFLTSSPSVQLSNIPFFTLSFNQTNGVDHSIIGHNCALIQADGLNLHIFTDNLTQPVCSSSSCTYHIYQPKPCSCPHALPNERCFYTKLHFLRDILIDSSDTFDEFVFIHSDVIIVQPEQFIPALLTRTTHFDFLAPYSYQN